jgi:hypothetical protein
MFELDFFTVVCVIKSLMGHLVYVLEGMDEKREEVIEKNPSINGQTTTNIYFFIVDSPPTDDDDDQQDNDDDNNDDDDNDSSRLRHDVIVTFYINYISVHQSSFRKLIWTNQQLFIRMKREKSGDKRLSSMFSFFSFLLPFSLSSHRFFQVNLVYRIEAQ